MIEFLADESEALVFKMNERLDFGSQKAKLVQRIFQRYHGHGIIYGKFISKEALPEFNTKNLEKDKARIFPNGRIKFMEN